MRDQFLEQIILLTKNNSWEKVNKIDIFPQQKLEYINSKGETATIYLHDKTYTLEVNGMKAEKEIINE